MFGFHLSEQQVNIVVAAIQLALAIVIMPTIWNRLAQVPRATSIPTMAGLYALAVAYAGRDLWAAVTMSLLAAAMWTFVAVRRPVKPRVTMAFGLRAQGHIPTVERMLKCGHAWSVIGDAIGWDGETARRFYEREAQKVAVVTGATT